MAQTPDESPSADGPTGKVPLIFTDGFAGATLQDFVMRINLAANHVTLDGKPDHILIARLVMSLPAFLRMHREISDIVGELEAQGVIGRTTERADAGETS